MKKHSVFSGVGAAMVTPFDRNGNIDYSVLERYIEHLISGGVNALIPFGTTGESSTVTDSEFEDAVRFITKKTRRRVPVIVGAGSNNTVRAAYKCAAARRLGADAVLVVTPYYNKCTQQGIVEHYKAVAKEAKIPVVLYNVPYRTCVNIEPETLAKLKKIDGVIGIKEASGNIESITKTAEACCEIGLDLYCGDDAHTVTTMALGGIGAISVAANLVPERMNKMCSLCRSGDYASARKIQFDLSELISALFCEVNPIPIKKALQLYGIDVGLPRLPLTELEKAHTKRLWSAMLSMGLIK